MISLFQELPNELLDKAFKCGDEFAWSRPDTLEVIKWADRQGFNVIGAEVWVPSPRGPIIPARYVYVWSLGMYASGPQSARDYVRNFEWDPNDTGFLNSEPFFNLTLAEN